MGKIDVTNLTKTFNNGPTVFENINLSIPDEAFAVILGPSGCGKSTLLRMIAGLDTVTSGKITIDDTDITHADPKARDIAMVFQNYALYPHMTVFQNVEYSMKIKKIDKQDRQERVMDALKVVKMADFKDRKPAQLSGGQQQRVALARAIVKKPAVFLMDEPLSNLDAKLRGEMRDMIADLHQQLHTTFVYVTHDQSEAMAMADHIILLDDGKIQQEGDAKSLYTDPQNLFTSQFIGNPPANIIELDDGYLAIRPEAIHFSKEEPDDADLLTIKADLDDVHFMGSEALYYFTTDHGKIQVEQKNTWQTSLDVNYLTVADENALFFDKDGKRVKDNDAIAALKGKVS